MPSEPTVSGDRSVEELKRELAEAREQQAATSEILRVISGSPTDLQRVFTEAAAAAARLCDAYDAGILQVARDHWRIVAHHGPIPIIAQGPPTRGLPTGRAVLDRQTLHVADLQAETDEYPEGSEFAHRLGYRTILCVPLLRAGEAIGVIFIRRTEVRPFTNRQIELLKTFADQAVIAIENARLFEEVQARTRELTQSLEHQTATSEVLGVISRSPTDAQPVFDSIAQSAAQLCGAQHCNVYQFDGRLIHFAATHLVPGMPPQAREANMKQPPIAPGRGNAAARSIAYGTVAEIPDIDADPDYERRDVTRISNLRSTMSVPMLKDGHPIGAIVVSRSEKGRFSERQIKLLQTFADQAVIAIENTRLFNEIAQKSRELEIASQHKSQFVANMSHELRTPLAAMLGYAELLQEGIYGAPPEKFLPILTRIRSNGTHLLGLINTVLDISKIEAGQFKLNLAEYALGSIVETVMVATESLAATKKLAFKTEVAKGLPHGLGDEQRLTQVLLNLVGNAIKFTDAGEVRITAGAENGHFALCVSDTGPGIPAEECDRIFEKFRQVDSSNTRAKGGTGLGLAIAREIVEMHGGRIWVESTVGQGSTFRMELPVRAAAAGAT
jgi:signal transduction histidine kinase